MAQVELLVGLDIGTTMTKAAVVGPDGKEIAWGSVPTPWRAVPSGAEAAPADLLGAALQAAGAALEAAPRGRVAGLGVTSMAETVVLLGHDGRPLAPSIAWHDDRGADEAADLRSVFGATAFSERTGLAASPMCTLVKLAWRSRHNGPPARRAMSVADWVVHSLGGAQVAEASLASRTGALSLAGRRWWAEGLEWAGAPPDLFGPVVQAGEPLGRVTLEALRRAPGPARPYPAALESLDGAALTSAGHDHMCIAASLGVMGPAHILDSCGTAEAFVMTVAPVDGPGAARAVDAGISVGWSAVPGRYALLSGQMLGLLFERVLALLGVVGPDALAALDAAAQTTPTGCLRVVKEELEARASILDLDASASPAALWSATLNCLSDGAQRIVGAMRSVAGPAGRAGAEGVEELVLSGGWAHCTGLRQRRKGLFANVRWPAVNEAGARGAAMFGGSAAGLFSGPTDFPRPADRPLGLC
jgi:sugar (pentulose or hexulose) kinase